MTLSINWHDAWRLVQRDNNFQAFLYLLFARILPPTSIVRQFLLVRWPCLSLLHKKEAGWYESNIINQSETHERGRTGTMKLPRSECFQARMATLALVTILLISTTCLGVAADTTVPFAVQGAYATFVAEGGFIPFFSGVNGTISYVVTSVYTNGTMHVTVSTNMSQGEEVPETFQVFNYTDSISHPKVFPAIPTSQLASAQVLFENVTCSYVKSANISVPAGSFSTVEYSGKDANGSQYYFWFDRSTGLAIQMAGGAGAYQLQASNVATPMSIPSGLSTSFPFITVFGTVWVIAAIVFVGLWKYYNRKKPSFVDLNDTKRKITRKK